MLSFQDRIEERKQQYKSTTEQTPRRRRESDAVQLRKVAREEQLCLKRRHLSTEDQENVPQDQVLRPAPELVAELAAGGPRLEATRGLRLLCEREDPKLLHAAVESGALPELMRSLRDPDANVQLEAAWAMTNIACGEPNSSLAKALAYTEGAVQTLVELAQTGALPVRDQAVWALGNLAGDCVELRDVLVAAGALPALLRTIVECEHMPALLRNGTWALRNCVSGLPAPAGAEQAAPILGCLTHCTDVDVVVDSLWGLGYLSEDAPQYAIDSKALGHVVTLLKQQDKAVLVPALRICGNVAAGSDEQTRVLLDCDLLEHVKPLLSAPEQSLRKNAAWLLANVAAGPPAQVHSLLEEHIFQELLPLASSGPALVRREAVWALTNACLSGSVPQVQHMATLGVVPVLCHNLGGQPDVARAVLHALRSVLAAGRAEAEEFGTANWAAQQVEEAGLQKLEDLAMHDDKEMAATAAWLLQTYFSEDEGGLGMEVVSEPLVAPTSFDFTVTPQR